MQESLKPAAANSRLAFIFLPAAIAFAAAFQLLFYSTPLYNSAAKPENRIVRWQILPLAIAASTPGNPNWWDLTRQRFSHPENLKQRLPMLAFATGAWLAAIAIGYAVRQVVVRVETDSRLENALIDFGLGMGILSLAIQGLGLIGKCNQWTLSAVAIAATLLALATWLRNRRERTSDRERTSKDEFDITLNTQFPVPRTQYPMLGARSSTALRVSVLVIGCLFAGIALLAALLPTTDYDALGYHLLGPKEWFERGRIEQLPHNVYTTFPFLTEMFAYAGMVGLCDWFKGGIAGQATLWIFGPATAAAVGILAARLFGNPAGWWAALIYISTPWTYRLSSIPYVEGAMNFYAVLALLAALRSGESTKWSFLAGCMAGCAVSCKYPGLVFVAIPTALICLWNGWRRVDTLPAFAIGVALLFGPWLARNYVWTGNPVFPLLANHIKTRNWPPEKAERFAAAHRSKSFTMADAFEHSSIVAWKSDWQTAMAFSFAPLALFNFVNRRQALFLWLLVFALFAVFWGLTHRLDRFFLTLEPPLITLAAGGLTWSASRVWRWFAIACVAVSLPYHLVYCTCGLCGLPNYTADLRSQWQSNWQGEPAVLVANDTRIVPADSYVMVLGYSAIYNCQPMAMYATVFDDNAFEQIARNPEAPQPDALKPGFRIQAAFDTLKLDFVIVDWSWIKRYREPGNYGYPAFVQPAVFARLCQMGVFEKVPLPHSFPLETEVEVYRVIRTKSIGADH